MKAILAAFWGMALTAGAAVADGGVSVQLPDVSQLPQPQAEALIAQLAQLNVITSNCPQWPISDGEWALITGTGDLLAAQLGLDAAAYDAAYYGPAFKLLDDPGACDRIGPTAKPLIGRLVGMGGGTTPIAQSQ